MDLLTLDDVLAAIEVELKSLADQVKERDRDLIETSDIALSGVDMITYNLAEIGDHKKAFQKLNYQVLQRINDIEIGFNQSYIRDLARGANIQPIELSTEYGNIQITSTDDPVFYLPSDVGGPYEGNEYEFYFTASIKIRYFESNEEDLYLWQNLAFSLDAEGRLGAVCTKAPRFYKVGKGLYDPIQNVPVREQYETRKKMIEGIKYLVDRFKVRIPDVNFGGLSLDAIPSTYFLRKGPSTGKLFVQCREQNVVRNDELRRNPLQYVHVGYSSSVLLCREIVDQFLGKWLKEYEEEGIATLIATDYSKEDMEIDFSIIRNDSIPVADLFDDVDVRIEIYLGYKIHLTVEKNGMLLLTGYRQSGRYVIDADNCFAFCEFVQLFVANRVDSEVVKRDVIIENLGYVDQSIRSAIVRTEKTGLSFHIKR